MTLPKSIWEKRQEEDHHSTVDRLAAKKLDTVAKALAEAQDKIQAIQEERDRYKRQRDHLQASVHALQQENETIREALKGVLKWYTNTNTAMPYALFQQIAALLEVDVTTRRDPAHSEPVEKVPAEL